MAKRSPRLLFTEEELETPELQKPIKKAEQAQKKLTQMKLSKKQQVLYLYVKAKLFRHITPLLLGEEQIQEDKSGHMIYHS